ncbi:MAG: 30S ribosome-binding factor RbfA [Balneolaceae bacterium]
MSIRTERLGSVIQRDLGTILQRNYQPPGSLITVTGVRMTDDLSIAKVYLSVFSPDGDPKAVMQHIDRHQDQIRYELASKIRHQVRRIPQLLFFEDDTAEYVNRIEKIFKEVKPDDDSSETDQ